MRALRLWWWVGAVALGAGAACSSEGQPATLQLASLGGGGEAPASGSGGDPDPFEGPGSGGSGASGDDGSCAAEAFAADPVQLDMYIMLDASGSMAEDSGEPGVTKWQAVNEALLAFFADPAVQDVAVGLQYFPLTLPSVPASCSSHAQCGAGGPCSISTCDNSSVVDPCSSDAQCGGGECVPLGECLFGGGLCAPAVSGVYCDFFGFNPCVPLSSGYCENATSCDAGQYGTPAVALAPLAANEAALAASLAAHAPEGWTPTAAALDGAIDHAGAWAASHPGHTTVVVLATDGEPTRCDPLDAGGIAALASAGAAGSPAIASFVVGMLSPGDAAAQSLLDQVAFAGGTQQAYLVDPQSQDLSQDFLMTLEQIQKSALACEYQIPAPDGMQAIDYGEVNVEHTPPDTTEADTILYVAEASSCDPDTGGWYYDVDPAGGDPSKILMCPATCELFADGGEVQILVGCETTTAPPPK